jgi:hypothetical protein
MLANLRLRALKFKFEILEVFIYLSNLLGLSWKINDFLINPFGRITILLGIKKYNERLNLIFSCQIVIDFN